jgi:uncharacterized protein (TIGR03067 family)
VAPAVPIKAAPSSAESERTKFHGEWQGLSVNVNGNQALPAVAQEYLYRFEDMQYRVSRKGNVESKGSFLLDPTKSPAWIDLAEDSNVTIFGIYRFEADKLTLCVHEKTRPADFNPPARRGYMVIVLQRTTPR